MKYESSVKISNKKATVLWLLILLLIIPVFVYLYALPIYAIDTHIKYTTPFEIFLSISKPVEKMGAGNALIAHSKDMTKEQKKLIYSHINTMKTIKSDKLKFQETYLQNLAGDFVRVRFDNGRTFYFEPNSNIYSNENTLTHKRFYVDTDEFYIWFNQLQDELHEFSGVSFENRINAFLSIMYPDKIKLIAGNDEIVKHNHDNFKIFSKLEYSDQKNYDVGYGITNKQVNRVANMIDCIIKSDIIYNFNSADKICTNDMLVYAELRSRYFDDTMVDESNNVHMTTSILDIFQEDFNYYNDVENQSNSKPTKEYVVPLNPVGNSSNIISIERDGAYLLVTTEAKLSKSSRFWEQAGKSIQIRYKVCSWGSKDFYIISAEIVNA